MTTAANFRQELETWINGMPDRRALLVEEGGIADSTLRLTLSGRYNPGELLEKSLRQVMQKYPLNMVSRAVSEV